MGYLAYILAALILFLGKDTSSMTSTEIVDVVLDQAVVINAVFLVMIGLLTFATILLGMLSIKIEFPFGIFTSAVAVWFLIIGCFGQFVVMILNKGMASSWGPNGVTDPTLFWITTGLTVLLGIT